MGLHHCLYDNEEQLPLPNVCDRAHQYPEESCPPLCMCIGLTLNFRNISRVDAYPSLHALSVTYSGDDHRYPTFLKSSSIRYLILTDLVVIPDHFFRRLYRLSLLDASNNRLSFLPDHLFSDLFSLETLNLAFNEIANISRSLFSNLTKLRTVDLSHNGITSLPDGLFRASPLDKLDLSHNKISDVAEYAFAGLKKLYRLDLSFNELAMLPSGTFSGLSELYYLHLNNNRLATLHSRIFATLYYLFELNLSDNALETLPNHTFDGMVWNANLYLARNKLSVIPDGIFPFYEPVILDLSVNALENLPDDILTDGDTLKVLRLDRNNISVLPDNIFKRMLVLSELDLSSNTIYNLPKDVFRSLASLLELNMKRNKLSYIPNNAFRTLKKLSFLDLSTNEIQYISNRVFQGLTALVQLSLSQNRISAIESNAFKGLKSLYQLDLSNNKIHSLFKHTFKGLGNLRNLMVANNHIRTVHVDAFVGLSGLTYFEFNNNKIATLPAKVFTDMRSLVYLDMAYNRLNYVPKNVFKGIAGRVFLRLDNNRIEDFPRLPENTKMLDISNNAIKSIPTGSFANASKLYFLNIMGNELEITQHIFKGLDNLRYLLTDIPFICCNKPKSVSKDKCLELKDSNKNCLRTMEGCEIAKSDAISSCSNLISTGVLRVFLWIIGISALLGNFTVIFYRLVFDRDNIKNTYAIFVLNLGVSDFFMGIYLAIIGIADYYYSGEYAWNDQEWRKSIFCVIGGIFSFISSEMSTFLILLVTLDRFLVIVLPLSHLARWRISWIQAVFISAFFWIVSITLSIIPVASFQSYFKGDYYSQAGVCLALPLLGENQNGAEYSFAVFVYLNSFIFGVIALGQILIMYTIRAKTKGITSSATAQRERTVAKTLFLVVATDFCCWFPVGIMGVMAKFGIKISDLAYAWLIVFVLPINAAVNPFLYTVTAIWRKRKREYNRTSMTSTSRQRRQRETIVMETSATCKGTKHETHSV
ncbi:relaxin receptor 2-like [Pecten maximus]|uniref:relaxin receptor 2-like n=1 Tax=Pecten maximus TaxID=6579 RepID=UPI0014587690|nr:relaxin receptor 2-like [Pecten maximus]